MAPVAQLRNNFSQLIDGLAAVFERKTNVFTDRIVTNHIESRLKGIKTRLKNKKFRPQNSDISRCVF
jgi:hypothetical protein